jgi:hypothetical protein
LRSCGGRGANRAGAWNLARPDSKLNCLRRSDVRRDQYERRRPRVSAGGVTTQRPGGLETTGLETRATTTRSPPPRTATAACVPTLASDHPHPLPPRRHPEGAAAQTHQRSPESGGDRRIFSRGGDTGCASHVCHHPIPRCLSPAGARNVPATPRGNATSAFAFADVEVGDVEPGDGHRSRRWERHEGPTDRNLTKRCGRTEGLADSMRGVASPWGCHRPGSSVRSVCRCLGYRSCGRRHALV